MSHMASSEPHGPHPWLTFLATAALGVGASIATTAFMAGGRDADLRHVQEQAAALQQQVGALTTRANGTDVNLGNITTELRFIRDDLRDVKALLQGRAPKYGRGE